MRGVVLLLPIQAFAILNEGTSQHRAPKEGGDAVEWMMMTKEGQKIEDDVLVEESQTQLAVLAFFDLIH